ncbi:RNA polymerase factor sigma-54 [Dechloromonas denitrificans]|uniref:RNA polymerase factor sigma-54 n=1 Tax=Dechloromonas denitrificans TaxID=281362 RepID=UPI001CF90419|nr:RNA polymerase factor sigma-54 [Dechloromonas denitrificans]UCV03653.1 RNA polymerase factor sigma-54 [Dechloromonas denitrificans]UCV07913.1 RNA polymerase factor sigma-54 [Dechloromonas denitrificans]
MKPALQLKLSQHLALTPQLQQSIKLLQLSTIEMQQELERYLLENPMLERDDDQGSESFVGAQQFDAPQTSEGEREQRVEREERDAREEREKDVPAAPSDVDDDRWASDAGTFTGAGRDDDDDSDAQDIHGGTISLRDHLGWQLGMTQLSERDRGLVRFLIEALDDDGYLSSPLQELLETLPAEYEIELDDLEIALNYIQSFDPTGIGARSPQECLALQLKVLPPSAERTLALTIVEKHLELLAARDFAKIRRSTGCDDEALKAAHALITSLNPRPGADFAQVEARYITPDVIVKKLKGKWTAYINPDAYPRLRINRLYAEILARQRRGNGNLTGQLQEARWLIKNVQQRFETIHRVTQAIVDRQRQFFEHGEVAMRPLVLREIADILGLHESTVSRVTSQKYMATPRGIFELKYFFGSHVATDTGGACSATAIRALIKQLVGAEDGKKPLSDSQLSEILGQQGIVVARRTVAKYRESLSIPPVNLRKTL